MRRKLVTLLVASVLTVAGLAYAQQNKGEAESAAPKAAVEQKQAEPGPSAQNQVGSKLAEASNEAAGEKEGGDHSELKQSAAVKGLAKITGLSVDWAYRISIILNFVILAALIVLISRSKLPAAFKTRTDVIQRGIREAQKASEDANRRLADIESRLAKLDSEIASMRTTAEAESSAEEERIRQAAEAEKQKIVQGAESEIAAAAKLARRELKTYAAELAVSLAANRIHVDADTDHVLVNNFVAQLGGPGTPGKDGK